MKHVKSFNQVYEGRTSDELLRDKLVRRISPKKINIVVERLIEEVKKEDKNEEYIKCLMWVLGIDGSKHVWIEGNDLKITR